MPPEAICDEPTPMKLRSVGGNRADWQKPFGIDFRPLPIARTSRRWPAAFAALRPHQWVKNLLVLLPLFLAHQVNPLDRLWAVLAATCAFCGVASCIYLLNDLIDIERDRCHRTKCTRPIASGELSKSAALRWAVAIGVGGLVVACKCVSAPFAGLLALYAALAIAYSLFIKRQLLLDVVVLAGLYTLRVAAGAVAAEVPLSPWLAAFAMFFFFSLALGKRYIEVRRLGVGAVPLNTGRGYRADDAQLLEAIGPASGYLSVLVFCLYIESDAVAMLYRNGWLLWAVCPVLLYWTTRFWLLARRQEVDDDPVVFALKDGASLASIAVTAFVVLAASA